MKWVFTEAILAVRASFIECTQLTIYFYLLFVNIRGRDMWGRWILNKSFILLSCLRLSDVTLDGCLRVWIADLLLYLSFKDSLKRDGNRTRKNKARGWFSACHCCTTISLHEMFNKPSLRSMPAFQNNSPHAWKEKGTECVFWHCPHSWNSSEEARNGKGNHETCLDIGQLGLHQWDMSGCFTYFRALLYIIPHVYGVRVSKWERM